MCIIIHKPEGKRIPHEIIQRAKAINPHGFGVTYLDNGRTRRTLDYTGVNRILNTNRPLVAHFRFATVGAVDINNVHPFSVDNRTVIYSNGTVSGYGSDHKSDIAEIADEVLPRMQPHQ